MKNLFLVAISIVLLTACSNPKTGWVDGQEIYDGFALTKKRQTEFTVQRDRKLAILDSLKHNIIEIENKLRVLDTPPKDEVKKYEDLVKLFRTQQEKFETENTTISNQFRKEILIQLQEKVKDYGTENGYEYIYGDWEQGNLMYAKEANDITKVVIAFLNE